MASPGNWLIKPLIVCVVCVQQPSHEDPLNPDAAALLRASSQGFQAVVRHVMTNGYRGETYYPLFKQHMKAASHHQSRLK